MQHYITQSDGTSLPLQSDHEQTKIEPTDIDVVDATDADGWEPVEETHKDSSPIPSDPSPKPPRRKRHVASQPRTPPLILDIVKEYINTVPSESFRESVFQKKLDFRFLPHQNLEGGEKELNAEMFDLAVNSDSPNNYAIQHHEKTLHEHLQVMESIQKRRLASTLELARIKFLIPKVKEQIEESFRIRKECWLKMRELHTISGRVEAGTQSSFKWHRFGPDVRYLNLIEEYSFFSIRNMEPITALIFILTAVLHLFSTVSHADLRQFILPSMCLLAQMAIGDSVLQDRLKIPTTIPSDVRTVISSLQVDPKIRKMVCCPKCFATYTFDNHDPSSFPEFCTFQDTPNSSQCNRRLRPKEVNARGVIVPTRQFVYQDLRHWIARMYARPEIEAAIDSLKISPHKDNNGAQELRDIWDGSILREFKGPDKMPFLEKPASEGRLAFGLNMDGFNPYGNKEAGKHTSICGIYLVCLNLPIHLRYRMENIFLLGVVPGPHEPSTHEVNHLLRPLVDDLLYLWDHGIYLTQTSKFPFGRRIRCALIPIISDLPAARRVAGLGGHSASYFCSECLLKLEDINDLDIDSWKSRTFEEHCSHAKAWRDAQTQSERTKIFRDYGSKWSELLRLPYWDPTKYVVIDSMHGFYLRIFQRHIRDVWGMNVKFDDGEIKPPDIDIDLNAKSRAQHILRYGSLSELQNLSRKDMQYLCRENGYHYAGHKAYLVKLLIKHVSLPLFNYWILSADIRAAG